MHTSAIPNRPNKWCRLCKRSSQTKGKQAEATFMQPDSPLKI
jgi:hypothetical protein